VESWSLGFNSYQQPGCAPYTVNLETRYLSSVPGTVYYADWGDGTPIETFTQTNATGVVMTAHVSNSSVDCGYDLTIDASNACNPQGSVVPINTQVIVWTHDVISINPQVFRVCQGLRKHFRSPTTATGIVFREPQKRNSDPRWIQWIYGTGQRLRDSRCASECRCNLPAAGLSRSTALMTSPRTGLQIEASRRLWRHS